MSDEATTPQEDQNAAADLPAPVSAQAGAERPALAVRVWVTFVLLLILALGLGLRLHELDRRSMWMDEFWAMAVSGGKALESGQPAYTIIDPAPPPPTSLESAVPWWRVWHATGETTHPPLFYLALRFWREAFGESQSVARGMAVAFSLAAIVLMYDVGRHVAGRTAALWAALLMAVAVPQIVNAQEVRNYTMQLFLALAAASAVVRIERAGPSWLRIGSLALSLASLMLTHYFSFGFAVGLFAYAMLRLRGRGRWLTVVACVAAAALFVVTWGAGMWEQRVEFDVSPVMNDWLWDPNPGRAWRAIGDALLVPAQLICPLDEETAVAGYLGGVLYALPLALWRRRPDQHLAALWLLFSVGMLLLMDTSRSSKHLEHLRYSFIASPAVFLLLATLLNPSRWLRHALPALAALSCALPLRTHYEEAYVDWRWPADGLSTMAQPGDVFVFSSENGPPYHAHYGFMGLSHYMGRLPGPVVIAPQRPPAELVEELRRKGRRTWLITAMGWVDVEEILPGARLEARHQYLGTVEAWLVSWPAEEPAEPTSRVGFAPPRKLAS